jgi:hypothetical protein
MGSKICKRSIKARKTVESIDDQKIIAKEECSVITQVQLPHL